jgi:BMFP domain-containing protein YqiC
MSSAVSLVDTSSATSLQYNRVYIAGLCGCCDRTLSSLEEMPLVQVEEIIVPKDNALSTSEKKAELLKDVAEHGTRYVNNQVRYIFSVGTQTTESTSIVSTLLQSDSNIHAAPEDVISAFLQYMSPLKEKQSPYCREFSFFDAEGYKWTYAGDLQNCDCGVVKFRLIYLKKTPHAIRLWEQEFQQQLSEIDKQLEAVRGRLISSADLVQRWNQSTFSLFQLRSIDENKDEFELCCVDRSPVGGDCSIVSRWHVLRRLRISCYLKRQHLSEKTALADRCS